jgi:hypothetical protein
MAVWMREPNVYRMLRSLTAKHFIEWEAYLQLHPFAFDIEKRADYRTAHIVQTMLNIMRSEKHKPQPWTLDECLIAFDPKPVEDEKPKAPRQEQWQLNKQVAYAIAMAYSVPAVES